ncbi:MAG: hypothetical protein M1840_004620 [Geoglossum simile]|nr:MAG: hypothetical protein M1840_004620 [Geoglossum simile]
MNSSSSEPNAPSTEVLQYYYDYVSSDGMVYWSLKDEFLKYNYPRTYIIGQTQGEVPAQWTCLESYCDGVFTRKADLQRHITTRHNPNPPQHECPFKKCNRRGEDAFTRDDHLREHLRNYHKVTTLPKRGGGEGKNSA